MTKTVHYTELRTNLAAYLDRAAKYNGEPIMVERKGKATVALIDAAELSSLLELVHLLSSPANAKRLFQALEQPGIPMTLEEFFAQHRADNL